MTDPNDSPTSIARSKPSPPDESFSDDKFVHLDHPARPDDATVIGAGTFNRNANSGSDSRVSPPAQTLGKYTIGEQIGRGGMGVVWKAFDPDLQRTVAIKVLADHLAQSPTSRRRFRREARAAAAISHAHVLTIHAVEEDNGIPFLVMEYVSGQSLKELLAEKGKLDFVEFIQLGCQTAQGLAAAHAQGVIHRDVKPGNVMLDEGATRARLTDFGLARVAFDNQELTSNDQCVGTPSYMSPESLRGERIDSRSDLFSLGCVFYRMLSGYAPFQGRTQGEVIHKILGSNPVRLDELDRSIPPVLSDLVGRLLQKNPDERYQSAAEVADILSRLNNQVNQAPTDEIERVLAIATATPRRPATTNKRGWWPATTAVATLCLIFGLVWILQPKTPSATEVSGRMSTGISNPVPINKSNPPDAIPDANRLKNITVGNGANAQFATVSEAVRHADTGATIHVIGPGPLIDSAMIKGSSLNGLRLIANPRMQWRCKDGDQPQCLSIMDVGDIQIQGFDFEIDSAANRAIQLTGDVQGAEISECNFLHTGKDHKLSLLLVSTRPGDDKSVVTTRQCRFKAVGTAAKCVTFGSPDSAARVVCKDCRFEASDNHIYADDGCRDLQLQHNVFVGGSVGVNLNFRTWQPKSSVSIVNNTFVGQKHWLSLGDSFRSGALPSKPANSRICNNLILGGQRELGGDDQWTVAMDVWKFECNWFERDNTTRSTAGRNGRIAELHDHLDIPVRDDITSNNYLLPAAGSDLLTSGVGGDLPIYIGARSPDSHQPLP